MNENEKLINKNKTIENNIKKFILNKIYKKKI